MVLAPHALMVAEIGISRNTIIQTALPIAFGFAQ
jgi:hypothetical protein